MDGLDAYGDGKGLETYPDNVNEEQALFNEEVCTRNRICEYQDAMSNLVSPSGTI